MLLNLLTPKLTDTEQAKYSIDPPRSQNLSEYEKFTCTKTRNTEMKQYDDDNDNNKTIVVTIIIARRRRRERKRMIIRIIS